MKVPKTISHQHRLKDTQELLAAFLGEASMLEGKLGCLLLQLPPSLAFDAAIATHFFGALRSLYPGAVALEPRHASWFDAKADRLLVKHRIARVAADPAPVPEAAIPAGWRKTVYYRLHGSPRRYYSSYDGTCLATLRTVLTEHRARGAEVWCIFDNTASGAALGNALELERLLEAAAPAPRRASGLATAR